MPHPVAELSHLHAELRPAVPGQKAIANFVEAVLVKHYNSGRVLCVHHLLTRQPPQGSWQFSSQRRYFEYALLDGHWITSASHTQWSNAGSSIIVVIWNGGRFAGIIESIFHHDQWNILNDTIWAEICWMKHSDLCPIKGNPWSEL